MALVSLFLYVYLLCSVPLATQAFVVTPRHAPATAAARSAPFEYRRTELFSSMTNDDLKATILEGLIEAGGADEDWKQSAQVIADLLQVDYTEGEQVLAIATRWKTWATSGKLARRFVTPVLPDPAKLQSSIDWLQQGPLGLTLEQTQENVRKHAAVYLLEPDVSYKKAISAAPRQYRDPEVFRSLILIDPTVLQCYYNCDNDCASECGSCWVTYANRL